MKAESNVMPQQSFEVDKRGNMADITFFDDVRESQREEQTIWLYETYSLTIPYRDDIESLISEQYDLWLNTAKACEQQVPQMPTTEERLQMAENAINFLLGL